jgi:hypothetical protein
MKEIQNRHTSGYASRFLQPSTHEVQKHPFKFCSCGKFPWTFEAKCCLHILGRSVTKGWQTLHADRHKLSVSDNETGHLSSILRSWKKLRNCAVTKPMRKHHKYFIIYNYLLIWCYEKIWSWEIVVKFYDTQCFKIAKEMTKYTQSLKCEKLL